MPGIGRVAATISAPNEYPLLEKVSSDKSTALPKLTSTKLIVSAIKTSEESNSESVIVTLLAAVKTQDPSTIWPCAQSETVDTSVISAMKSTFMSLEWGGIIGICKFFFAGIGT
jgi:hypothetical protein